jgi:hypothetical protein
MILDEFVEVIINPKMYRFYTNLGYSVNKGSKNKIKISDLSDGSVYKINCKCDICGSESKMEYRQYLKNVKSYNFYSCRRCTHIKTEITNMCKYGTKMPLNDKNSPVYNKRKKSMIDNYGVEHLWQNNDEYENVFISKYGVSNISKLESVKKKKIEKSIQKYGTENVFQSEEIKRKIRSTNLEKYGFEYPSQSNFIKDKSKITSIKNYGFDHAMKNSEYFNNRQKILFKKISFNNTDITYQGSYELHFIQYSIENSIEFTNGPSIPYIMNDKSRIYHSDFYLPKYNLICEVKSTYTFNDDYEENILKKQYSINSGYNFLFIIDKNYIELEKIIKENE